MLVSALAVTTAGLQGCVALTLAGIATNLMGAAMGGGGAQSGESAGPAAQIQQALAGIDDQVSPSCSARLTRMQAASDWARPADNGEPAAGVWGDSGWQFDGRDTSLKPADMPLSASRPAPDGLRGPLPPWISPARNPRPPISSNEVVSSPIETQTAVARQESIAGKRCSVRPTCLPGMQAPVSMMVCEEDGQAGGGGETQQQRQDVIATQSASQRR